MLSSDRMIEVLADNNRIVKKSTQEVAKTCGFTWQENVSDLDARIARAEFTNIMQQISQNTAKLLLSKISDMVGYGILLHPDAKPIKQNEWVSIYAGERHRYQGDHHNLGGVSANHYGNLGRFFSHLPSNFELLQYDFDESINREDVATANLFIRDLVGQKKIPALLALTDINPGEIMGFSYGDNHWDYFKVQPMLFYKNGKIIDEKLYNKKDPLRRLLFHTAESLVMDFQILSKDESKRNRIKLCTSFEGFYQLMYELVIKEYENAVDQELQNRLFALYMLTCISELELIFSRHYDIQRLLSETNPPEELATVLGCFSENTDEPFDEHATLDTTIIRLKDLLAEPSTIQGVPSKIKPAIESILNRLTEFQAVCDTHQLSNPSCNMK